MAKDSSYRYGLLAEYIMILYLIFTGHKIIARRFKTKLGEIDIIASKGKNLIIFEVKARKYGELSTEIVSKRQINRIYSAVNIFLSENDKYVDYNILFSIILYKNMFNFRIVKG